MRVWTNCSAACEVGSWTRTGAAEALQSVGIGVGLQEGGAVAEVALRVAERGQDEVQLLAVVAATAQRGGGLDEQDLAVSVFSAVHRGS